MAVFWIAQGIGLIALCVSFFAYQSKHREEMLNRQFLGSFIYVAHFFLLSAWTGVAINAIVGVRNWVFIKKDSEAWARHPAWLYIFIGLALLSLFFTWEGYISILPTIALCLGVYARWQNQVSHIRLFSLVGMLLWLPYDFVVHSYAGVATELVLGVAILYGIWKHDRPTRVEKDISSAV